MLTTLSPTSAIPQTILPTTLVQTNPPSATMCAESSAVADDIWDDEIENHATEEVLSDLPAMKRQHMNDGYREGLTASKAKVMQAGFDEGYPMGVQIAMRAGPILGILEAYLACKSIDAIPGMRERVQITYKDAIRDLDIGSLFQNTDEEDIATLKTISVFVHDTLEYWEGQVTAVYKVRQLSMAVHDRDNPHALREMVEVAKRKDPVKFNTDHTDKVSLGPVVQEEYKEENQYRRKGRKPEW